MPGRVKIDFCHATTATLRADLEAKAPEVQAVKVEITSNNGEFSEEKARAFLKRFNGQNHCSTKRIQSQEAETLKLAIRNYGTVVYETPGSKRIYVIGVVHEDPTGEITDKDILKRIAENEVQTFRIVDYLCRNEKTKLMLYEGYPKGQKVGPFTQNDIEMLKERYKPVFWKIDAGDDFLKKVLTARSDDGRLEYGNHQILLSIRYGLNVIGAEDSQFHTLAMKLTGMITSGDQSVINAFVALIAQRSAVMLQNAVESARQDGTNPVLVTGAWHVEDIVDFLKLGVVNPLPVVLDNRILIPEVRRPIELAREDIGVTAIQTHASLEHSQFLQSSGQEGKPREQPRPGIK